MKTKSTFITLLLIISVAANSQNFIGIAYTSKFVGKTIDINYERQQNRHGFSARLLFYTNQPADAVFGIAKRDYPLSPGHFSELRDEAYGENFLQRLALSVGYAYYLRSEAAVVPCLSAAAAVSNIGFRSKYFPNSPQTVSSLRFVAEFFPAAGLKVKLYKNVFFKQSISPGLLYIDYSPFNSFSVNPTYSANLIVQLR